MTEPELPTLPQPLEPVVEALAPALDRLVIIGGWAHLLHRFHQLAKPLDDAPLMTSDCDVAIPVQAVATVWPPLDASLERAGFTLRQGGGELGESRIYVLRSDPNFSLQFLAVRRGDGRDRDGSVVRTVQVGGISAEVLGDLDLAAASPWSCSFLRSSGTAVSLTVAHPVAFVLGKILVSCAPQRGRNERAKDLLYVVDTLRLFGDRLEDLHAEARSTLDRVGKSRLRRLQQALRRHFVERSDELRRAVEQAQALPGSRPDSQAAFVRDCAQGLARLFGERVRWPE